MFKYTASVVPLDNDDTPIIVERVKFEAASWAGILGFVISQGVKSFTDKPIQGLRITLRRKEVA